VLRPPRDNEADADAWRRKSGHGKTRYIPTRGARAQGRGWGDARTKLWGGAGARAGRTVTQTKRASDGGSFARGSAVPARSREGGSPARGSAAPARGRDGGSPVRGSAAPAHRGRPMDRSGPKGASSQRGRSGESSTRTRSGAGSARSEGYGASRGRGSAKSGGAAGRSRSPSPKADGGKRSKNSSARRK
jgi:hypothetical protein